MNLNSMLKKAILLPVLLLLFTGYSLGQNDFILTKEYADSNIIEQIVLFPQEKLHLQIDKSLYVSGEKIWLRAWLVDAVLHKPVLNQYVYVELINQLNSVVNRVMLRQNQGALSGFIALNENLPEGNYTLCAYTESMQNLGEEYFFKKNIHIVTPLSASIHTIPEFSYGDDDKVTAEVSFVEIKTGKRTEPDGLKVRINDQPLQGIKMRNDTVIQFSFKLPSDSSQRDLYIENKKCGKLFTIPYPENDYEVSFYPEGGYLLDGVRCAVAIKALNSDGLPENVKCKIVDSEGNEYTNVETTHDGMGVFSIVSKDGAEYYADCTNGKGKGKRFKLPSAQKGMYSLAVKTIRNKLLVSVLQSSDINEKKPLYLLMHTRGIIQYASLLDDNHNSITFDKKMFPSGVMQIILFDNDMKPLSERLVFCQSDDQANVDFVTDKPDYEKRQLVNAGVKITDSRGVPLEGSFSVSVTEDNDVKADSTVSIMTSLLLTSELKGYINDPAFYFLENNKVAKQALDLLMMTNGWRRYSIPDVINGKYEKPQLIIKPGMKISGKVKRLLVDKPVGKGEVNIFSWGAGYFETTETNNEGRFVFDNIEYSDSTTFVIQALNNRGNNGVELFIDADSFPKISGLPLKYQTKKTVGKEEDQLIKYIKKADARYTIEHGIRTIYLNEVVVSDKAPENKNQSYSFYMPTNSSVNILTDKEMNFSQYSNLADIIRYIPFTTIVDGQVIINRMGYRMSDGSQPSNNYAALIIDDVIIRDYNINDIDPSNIEKIGVLKGAQAVLLGGDGAGGAIVITTKRGFTGKREIPVYNIKKSLPLGYQKPAEFYSPRYETQAQRSSSQPDMRSTIYWNPNVTVSALGEGIFDFYTADAPTTYTVVIEGITSDGKIIQSIKKISRKQAIRQ